MADTFLTNVGSGPNAPVYSIKTQPDGKVLVGGSFTSFSGATRSRLVRLNVEGTVDATFYTNLGLGFNNTVLAVAVQPDGKILVGGSFVNYGEVSGRNYCVRLNVDGTVDTAFCVNAVDGGKFNSMVKAITLQTDGKILVGGDFTNYGGVSGRNILVRVGSDGVLDAAFSTSLLSKFSILDGNYEIRAAYVDYNDWVYYWEVEDEGADAVYWSYREYNDDVGEYVYYHVVPAQVAYINFGQSVSTVKVTAQGQILVGGTFVFSTTGLRAVSYIALNTDGAASSTMQRLTLFRDGGGGVNGASVSAIEISASGNIYVGGYFNGGNIFALTSAGASASVATFGVVYSLTALTDGRMLVGNASGASVLLSSGSLDSTAFSPQGLSELTGRPVYSAAQLKEKESNFILFGGDARLVKTRLRSIGSVTMSSLIGTEGLLIPSGTVITFAGAAAPTGYLSCNGAAVSRALYSVLFSAIGTVHGYGDGLTTFHLPDYRGRFLRGFANGSTNDPNRTIRTAANVGGVAGDAVGSVQGQATVKNGMYNNASGITSNTVPDHSHAQVVVANGSSGSGYRQDYISDNANSSAYSQGVNTGGGGGHSHGGTAAAQTISSTDSETRPINANVNYIIKI